jgi:hypothetical protein
MPFPSIVPTNDEVDVYLVLDSFGTKLGRAWRETDEHDTDLPTLLRHLMEGQYNDPVRIVAFNTAEHWSRDVSGDIAQTLRRRFSELQKTAPPSLERFLDRYDDSRLGIQLALPMQI